MVYGINEKKHTKNIALHTYPMNPNTFWEGAPVTHSKAHSKYSISRSAITRAGSIEIYNTNVYMLCTTTSVCKKKKYPTNPTVYHHFSYRNDHVGIPLSNTSMSKENNWLLVLTRPKYTRHFNRSSQVSIVIWKGPIANISFFLHFLKTNVEPIHILVS
jgi:hypothetical protein